jgi:SRSO17 transposase
MWPIGSEPKRPEKTGKSGRPHTRYRDGDAKPVAISKAIFEIERNQFKEISWREGSKKQQTSHYFSTRIQLAERHAKGSPPSEPLWLLVEWPKNEIEPTKFWISNLPVETSEMTLIRYAKLRWRIERDYQELKQEIGLDHFEGRTWNGFHHHVLLCCVAHGFLALRRALFPPRQKTNVAKATQVYSTCSANKSWFLLPMLSKSIQTASEAYYVSAKLIR